MTTKFLFEAVAYLRARVHYLDEAIVSLERLPRRGPGRPANWERDLSLQLAWENRPKRRGRKPGQMTPAERQVVSVRMRKYWDARRKERSK